MRTPAIPRDTSRRRAASTVCRSTTGNRRTAALLAGRARVLQILSAERAARRGVRIELEAEPDLRGGHAGDEGEGAFGLGNDAGTRGPRSPRFRRPPPSRDGRPVSPAREGRRGPSCTGPRPGRARVRDGEAPVFRRGGLRHRRRHSSRPSATDGGDAELTAPEVSASVVWGVAPADGAVGPLEQPVMRSTQAASTRRWGDMGCLSASRRRDAL